MDIMNALSITTRAADTLTRVATYNWNKKSVVTLIVATAVLVGATAVVQQIVKKKEQTKKSAVGFNAN